jgi:putative heme-binding domain-containing protein
LVRAALQQARAEDRDASERVRAIRALSLSEWDHVAESLWSFIDSRQPIEIQSAAIETIGGFRDVDVATPLIDRWSELSPSLRSRASEVLFARPNWTLKLFDAVNEGRLSIGDIPRDRLTIAANSSIESVKSRALDYLGRVAATSRSSLISVYREALARDGDVQRGRDVFSRSCVGCHRLENRGHEIGPNLATIKARGAEAILVNVLDPNAEVNPQYLNYVLLTDDGRSVTGMIVAENANSITLRRAESAEDTILRSEIERLQSTGKSIMPEGMETAIDVQSMADLLSYLMQ